MILLATGCIAAPEPVYSVRRSALVPHPAVPMRTGFGLDQTVQLTASDSTVLEPVQPRETAGANAGLYVARHNISAGAIVRLSENTDIGVSAQWALRKGAMAVASDAALPPDEGNAYAIDFQLAHSFPINEQFHIGVVATAAQWTVPYYEQLHCIENCTGVADSEQSGEKQVVIWSLSLLPAVREGAFTAFAGVTLRNHPTNSKYDTESSTDLALDDAEDIRGGPTYTILEAGVEWAAAPSVKLLAVIQEPLSTDVVTYGPALAFAASFGFNLPKSTPPSPP